MARKYGVAIEAKVRENMINAQNHFHFIGKENGRIAINVMELLSNAGRALCIAEVASVLSIDISTVQYYFDLLIEHDLIVQTQAGFESSWTERNFPDLYVLTSRGRKYLLESKAA